jgi:hypothetical protein
MARNSDVIEEAMKLSNDCRNLRSQVAGIHAEPSSPGRVGSRSYDMRDPDALR